MSDKIEIDDAMVERAFLAVGTGDGNLERHHVRAALEAALNPPSEPEITVSGEMIEAGYSAFYQHPFKAPPEQRGVAHGAVVEGVCAIYRAMRAQEPQPECPPQEKSQRVIPGAQTLGGNGKRRIHARLGDTDAYAHRRIGDWK